HIITRLILGGAQKNTVLCAKAQVAAGHRVIIAYGPIYGPEGSLLAEAQKAGVQTVELSSMRRAILPHHDVISYFQLRKLIKQTKPDIVHTHSSKAGITGRIAAWHCKAAGVRGVVHTVHGLPFHDKQPRWVHQLYVTLERIAAKRCHKIVGITQAMIDAFVEKRIGKPEQYDVIPSGVSVEEFQSPTADRHHTRKAYGIPDTAPVLGIVARLDPLKGHHDLLDIFPQLLKRHPDLRMFFVGDGWDRERIEQRIEDKGWDKQVILGGLVPPSQVPSLLGAMDIMALPSYQEGQGRTLVEALLCDCAIVGYDVGGIGEVCIDNQTGRLVKVGDKDQLMHAIDQLLEDEPKRKALAAAGKQHVMENFTETVMVQRLAKLYEQMLGHND
ncbi:MAG: glycosyltransferase family 4 protein, partial [Phycisphaeraceae bacterium JB051]